MTRLLGRQTVEEYKARKSIMEVAYLSLLVFLGLILLLSRPSSDASTAQTVSFVAQGLIAAAALVCFIFSRRGYVLVGVYFLPWGMLLLTFVLIYNTGVGSINALFFVTVTVVAGMLVGIRGVILFAVLSTLSTIGLSVAQNGGFLVAETRVSSLTSTIIVAHILGNAFVLILLIRTFNKNLYSALGANQELRQLQVDLEQRVIESTRDLRAASDVVRQITGMLDMDVLLPKLVQEIQRRFNLYSVRLYLYDQQTQELRLGAGTNREGVLLESEADGFHITAHPGAVAQAARECKATIINDVAPPADYPFNPQLPDARAEAAFPMLLSDGLVGVLDLQSETVGRFQENDAQFFATLAEQIAIAMRNAQSYREKERVAQEMERTDLMKSRFLASMSHELRTPLNAIINFTQLIAMGAAGPVTEDQLTMLNTSLSSSRYLLQLINDVLDISKIQAGKLSLYIEEDVNLYDEIRAVVGMAGPLLQKQNATLEQPIHFIQDIDDNLPLIACDRRRIRQVLLNLLSNAIKFTEKGSITLSAKSRGEGCVFAVMDTGPGIPQEMQTRIFEPFIQSADGIKHAQGTGLGLHISRSLAQAHGGDLWVESEIDEGTTFFFTLPIHPAVVG